MRRAILFVLLAATAAGPLAAQAWMGRGPDRDERERPREDGPDRPAGRGDWRGADDRGPPGEDRRADGPGDRPEWRASPAAPRRPDRDHAGRPDDRRDWRGPPGDFRDDERGGDRGGRRARDGGGRDYRWPENRRGGWDARWRDDRRYDWQGYRAGNRAIYRAPRYYGPRGAGYDRWVRGYRVEPSFYGRNYWISDPWRYRLPPAYGSYRWVRHHDDVALIDVRSGLIEDIVHGFFWR